MRESWDRISELFENAMELDPENRTAFLDQACASEPELHNEVERLLSEHDRAGDFIAEPLLPRAPELPEAHHEPRFTAGQVISGRFTIVRFIDHGGMGEVYEAQDQELHDRVALKVLRPELTLNERHMRRFRQEIQLARKITHPNVCRVFDVGIHRETSPGGYSSTIIFLTMEFLDGENLARYLERKGALSTDQALEILAQIIPALEAAHQAGIVHRDFKTANVTLTKASQPGKFRAVVTDFGVARSVEESGLGTSAGTQMFGTPAYMAPEQLEGGRVTVATDIYALGLVMYEMVTGKQPFTGPTPLAAGVKRLSETPPSPRVYAPHLQSVWEKVILRCLRRDAETRPARALDVLTLLQQPADGGQGRRSYAYVAIAAVLCLALVGSGRWYGAALSPKVFPVRRTSVAVLQFENPGRTEGAWLATAVAEALSASLGSHDELRAVPRDQVADIRIEGTGPLPRHIDERLAEQIARRLRADYVVYGSVAENQNRQIDLTVRLAKFGPDRSSAVINETGTEQDIAALVEKTAASIRRQLGVESRQQRSVNAALPQHREAAQLYAEGLHALRNYDFLSAREHLERAAKLEPAFAPTHSALASTLSSLGFQENASAQAKRALALSAGLTREERLRIEAQYFELLELWREAAERYRHLWEFAPEDMDYGLHLVGTLRAGDNCQEALRVISAMRASPTTPGEDPRIDLSEARTYLLMHDPRKALQSAEHAVLKSLTLNLRLPLGEARVLIGRARQSVGDISGAADAFREAEAIYRSANFFAGVAAALDGLSLVLNRQGEAANALEANEKALAIYRNMGEQARVASVLRNRAEILRDQRQMDMARNVLSNAIEISRQSGNRKLLGELSKFQEDLRIDRDGPERSWKN